MGCPGTDADVEDDLYDRGGMLATPEHVERAVGMGADFIVLGGNPGSGTRIADVLATTARVKGCYGDDVFAGGSSPENIHQLSISIKGMPYTYYRMASVNR